MFGQKTKFVGDLPEPKTPRPPIEFPVEIDENSYEIIGVEVKSNGYLDKTEKEKVKWLLDNKIFSQILIASKGKKRGEIIYSKCKD